MRPQSWYFKNFFIIDPTDNEDLNLCCGFCKGDTAWPSSTGRVVTGLPHIDKLMHPAQPNQISKDKPIEWGHIGGGQRVHILSGQLIKVFHISSIRKLRQDVLVIYTQSRTWNTSMHRAIQTRFHLTMFIFCCKVVPLRLVTLNFNVAAKRESHVIWKDLLDNGSHRKPNVGYQPFHNLDSWGPCPLSLDIVRRLKHHDFSQSGVPAGLFQVIWLHDFVVAPLFLWCPCFYSLTAPFPYIMDRFHHANTRQ